ncbi:MAG: A/G-specific adenine glycosylase [Gammaproteobacteria bacterium]|nr:A/G-specific adenine glycosylase [Gammaproteobacteria bacterium]
MSDDLFSNRLLAWFDQYGRKDLPWQSPRTAYRVWVSEIMLQQTQVVTVIDYFNRFMQRFDSLQSLAAASEDEVLHYWSGLGYYARCRNLHRTARLLIEQGLEELPADRDALQALPGIGRSTAAAILAQVWNQPQAILDGNVKRVLSRHQQISGWSGSSAVLKQLWSVAESLTPEQRVADYTQAIMDLGATVCKRSKPSCQQCPLAADCLALKNNCVAELPTPKKKKTLPQKARRFLIIKNQLQQVLLEKRPPSGIWGSLWSFPELEPEDDIKACCRQQLGINVKVIKELPLIRHSFSHYQLLITPTLLELVCEDDKIKESNDSHWYHKDQSHNLGLAAPVNAIINSIYLK